MISLTFSNSRQIKCVLHHVQPLDRLHSQGTFRAGCQDGADPAAWEPAPNTIHSCTGTKQEGRSGHRKSLRAQEKYIRKSILITANKAGNTSQTLVVITSIILRWVFGSPWRKSHLQPLPAPVAPLRCFPWPGKHKFSHAKGCRHHDFPDRTGRRTWAGCQPLQSHGALFTHSLQGEQGYKLKYHPLATSENVLAGHDKPPAFHRAPVTSAALLLFLLQPVSQPWKSLKCQVEG